MFPHDNIRKFTLASPDGKTQSNWPYFNI
jgi:hypothetical protein